MKKFYVDFPEDQMTKLRLLAGLEGKSASAFVREIILKVVKEHETMLVSIENLKNGVIDNGRND